MIIDVMDLKLGKIKFSRVYDTTRFRRAIAIYNHADVDIEKVEEVNENEYYITATVDGNYDLYKTNLKIVGNIITKSECTCEDYNNGNLCKHIIATSFEVTQPHKPSTPERKKEIEEQQKLEIQRRLEEYKKREEEERKKREYERKYFTGLRTIEEYKEISKQNTRETLDLNELYEETIESRNRKVGELATSMKLEYYVEIHDSSTLKVFFKIGQKRMYVLNDISQFYDAYINGTQLYYGKQLSFIPKREHFVEDSQPIFDYIIKYAEMIKYNNYSRYSSYGIDSSFNKAIYITKENIDEFWKLNNNKEVIVHYQYNEQDTYNFSNENLNIFCTLKRAMVNVPASVYHFYDEPKYEESEEYVLELNISDYAFVMSNTKMYVFYKNKIYTLEKNIDIIKLFDLFKYQDQIVIPDDRLDEFNKYVVPQIKYIKTENLPIEIEKEALLVNKLASKMLLDIDDNGNLMLELKFCYMDYEYNVLEKGYKAYIRENNIVRDVPAETEVIKRIFMDGFELVSGRKQFIMKNPDSIYEFLLYKIDGYMNDFEVLATEKFKNKPIRQPKISNIGIKIDNGLLELDISKINIDISEIKDVLKDYNIKKRYYKLKNGDFLSLENNNDLNLLNELTTTLDIDYSKIKDGKAELPVSRSLYLNKLVDSNKEINILKN